MVSLINLFNVSGNPNYTSKIEDSLEQGLLVKSVYKDNTLIVPCVCISHSSDISGIEIPDGKIPVKVAFLPTLSYYHSEYKTARTVCKKLLENYTDKILFKDTCYYTGEGLILNKDKVPLLMSARIYNIEDHTAMYSREILYVTGAFLEGLDNPVEKYLYNHYIPDFICEKRSQIRDLIMTPDLDDFVLKKTANKFSSDSLSRFVTAVKTDLSEML